MEKRVAEVIKVVKDLSGFVGMAKKFFSRMASGGDSIDRHADGDGSIDVK